jgi:phosphoesterase RecJ-like protein
LTMSSISLKHMTNQIIQHLKKSKRVLLASHIHPDGDAIGSTLALGLSLKALGKEVTLYNESLISAVYRFIPSVKWVVNHVTNISTYDSAVIIDCGDIERIGAIAENINQIPVVINIDHHVTNTGFGDFQLVDTTACASAEIVYGLIKKMAIPLNKDIATALYTAILTDTGSFRFSNTNRAAFGICEKMVGVGVDPYDVSQHVYGTYSLGRIKLLNLALDSIEISKNGKLSMMSLTQSMLEETGTQLEDGNDLINYARIIEDVKLAVLIQEQKKDKDRPLFHVSLRSDGSVNVADIASSFGGGGHCCAAGFDVNAKLSDIKAEISIIAETL